jgi:hypothetical protein
MSPNTMQGKENLEREDECNRQKKMLLLPNFVHEQMLPYTWDPQEMCQNSTGTHAGNTLSSPRDSKLTNV